MEKMSCDTILFHRLLGFKGAPAWPAHVRLMIEFLFMLWEWLTANYLKHFSARAACHQN